MSRVSYEHRSPSFDPLYELFSPFLSTAWNSFARSARRLLNYPLMRRPVEETAREDSPLLFTFLLSVPSFFRSPPPPSRPVPSSSSSSLSLSSAPPTLRNFCGQSVPRDYSGARYTRDCIRIRIAIIICERRTETKYDSWCRGATKEFERSNGRFLASVRTAIIQLIVPVQEN